MGSLFETNTTYRCYAPKVSANGRYVAFFAVAEATSNILVVCHDVLAGQSQVVGTNRTDIESTLELSDDGQFVLYGEETISMIWDRESGTNTALNLPGGPPSQDPGFWASHAVMTPDGHHAAFLSEGIVLDNGETNGIWQVVQRNLTNGTASLVSANANGQPGILHLDYAPPAISPDGRFVVFESLDGSLVSGDLNRSSDIFVRDVEAGTTRLITEVIPGRESTLGAALCATEIKALSADGSKIAFTSWDNTLAPGDTNGWQDAFVRDLNSGLTLPLSVEADGSFSPLRIFAREVALSGDGNEAAFLWEKPENFITYAVATTPGNVYWRSLTNGAPVPVNVNSAGELVGNCFSPRMSPDGRAVAFSCDADVSELVPGVGGGGYRYNVFLHDLLTGTNDLISVNLAGSGLYTPGTTNSTFSPDGRWVLFSASEANLTTNNVNHVPSLFGRDLLNRTTVLLSVGPNGEPNWGCAEGGTFSANSRRVAFVSTNFSVTVRDLEAQTTLVASTNGSAPNLNRDGTLVAFEAPANGTGPTNIFVRNLAQDTTELVSRSHTGNGGNGDSTTPLISGDGRYVVFTSRASDLVANDTNHVSDIFVHDRWLGTTLLVSLNQTGTGSGNGPSTKPVMAANGRTVVFQSFASDLVPNDYNGMRDVFVLQLGGADTDGDGLDDDWELAYFETLDRDGSGDFDHDGATDGDEFRAGTDPRNDGSVLRVMTITSPGSGSTTVLWSAVPGRSYRVQFKDEVTEAQWTDWGEVVTASSSTGAAVDLAAPATGHRFYRVLLVP